MINQSEQRDPLDAVPACQRQPPATPPSSATEPAACWPDYLTIKEAARLLGVSERSVYGYIEKHQLPFTHEGNLIVLETAEVQQFRRRVTGRPRVRQPEWHCSLPGNGQVLTHISVAVREGQSDALHACLDEINVQHRHQLPGTIARYIAHDAGEPERVRIVLIWRKAAMPPEEERIAALAALWVDLSGVLDWETAQCEEEELWLHT